MARPGGRPPPAGTEAQRVLVTGAAGGIGSAIVRRFLEVGGRVALADSDRPRLEEAQKSMGAGERTAAVHLDVRDRVSVESTIERAWEAFGGLDVLVNCAAIYPSHPVLEMEEEDWDAVLDTNLKGPFLLSRSFALRLVRESRGGHILNITSGAAKRARRGAAHYCTSKAALEVLTQSFALELAPHGIRVNAVSPGFVEVHSPVNPLSEEYRRAISGSIPLGRSGRPEDIAQAAVFMCSEAAEWITGASLSVDGGSGAGNLMLPLSRPSSRGDV
jgi:NAD(P)-dependent dehydrogenase (short-subunit alcohol dehydrogenase family)